MPACCHDAHVAMVLGASHLAPAPLAEGVRRQSPGSAQQLDRPQEHGLLEVEAISYIRGRSIPRQYMVVDEAQNLTPHEVKTIVTRVGEGTKIVLTGDPYQIDNPYVDAERNGLTWLVERFKGQRLAGHVTLQRGKRSELAELAANLL
jgi:PhoH-like ATPase